MSSQFPPQETIVVVDFGGQSVQLLARKIRELKVYSEVVPWLQAAQRLAQGGLAGVILSGGPGRTAETEAPRVVAEVLAAGIPVLAVGYGQQVMVEALGGETAPGPGGGEGLAEIEAGSAGPLLQGLTEPWQGWMSSCEQVVSLPAGFVTLARSKANPIVAMGDEQRRLYGVQFHPELSPGSEGLTVLRNFLYEICGCQGTWEAGSFIAEAVAELRAQVGAGRVLCALSGGVDSSVTAALLQQAIGSQLTCMFIDHGLLRQGEAATVCDTFGALLGEQFVFVDASERFLSRLAGVVDPEQKRKIIGETFIRVFEAESEKLGEFQFIAHGTLYPDVIESGGGATATIKTHHNVGGLPADMKYTNIEPLRRLFKDEVRQLGRELGLSAEIVQRQPFPGPGLAVRVAGEVTEERLAVVRKADAIMREEVAAAGLAGEVAQYFAAVIDSRSVGVQDSERTYAQPVVLRAVVTDDFMTARWYRLPYEVLERIATRIGSEVAGVNRVLYDVTSKPPGTIEWE